MIDNWLAKRAQTCPERTALVTSAGSTSYAELEHEATAMALRLAARGVRRGSSVALSLAPGHEYVVLLHALMKLGAVTWPVNTLLTEAERLEQEADIEPVLSIESADQVRNGSQADLPLLGEHDLSATHCRIYTSGTSGAPKPVDLTYGNHLWSAVGSAFNLGVDPADRWLCCLPLYHVGGLSIVLRSVVYGTGVVLHDGFDVDRVAESLERDGVTLVSLVATGLTRLMEAGADIARPRIILVGGGPVPESVLEEATAKGATVVQTYGLTEAASQVTTLAPEDAVRKLGSAGRPLFTTHLRIENGEILVQGPTVAPESLDEDGWLHTGDIGVIDEEGFLYVIDREGDLIVTGGENVAPVEVEDVLLRHPAVSEVAVVGRFDEEWQQAVTAIVVLREDAGKVSVDELRRHCREQLAAYKVPKRFEFSRELPRTPTGKLVRRALS